MPTITVQENDFFALLGKKLDYEALEKELELVKGELKGIDQEAGELKVELNDTNRPDLWTVEGITRQLRYKMRLSQPDYAFIENKPSPEHRITVENSVKTVRPAVAGFLVKNINITEEILLQLIQTQEKLCENYGSKRKSVAIGVYQSQDIQFPIIYKAVDPKSVKFVPLDFEEEMTLAEILKEHPKGKEYAHLVAEYDKYPLLTDSSGKVLSFPPVINSRVLGEVATSDSQLFLEATGYDLRTITLAMNIMAYNLVDRGATIEPVQAEYPYEIAGKKQHICPMPIDNQVVISTADFEKFVGESVTPDEITKQLEEYGCSVKAQDEKLTVKTADYRYDYLHPMDALEDYLMSRGYDSFEKVPPTSFTVGRLTPLTKFSDQVRTIVVGFGFEELICNVLLSREELSTRMRSEAPLVEIDNVMIETYAALRNSLVPSLLKLEASSQKAMYPHRVFEVGEVAVPNPEADNGSDTLMNCAMLMAHPEANFSELQSYLDNLAYYADFEYELNPIDHPTFIDGRAGQIVVQGTPCGIIGEVHPAVLANWNIKMPCTVCEVNLNVLLKLKEA